MTNTFTDVIITDKNIPLFPMVPSFEWEFPYTEEVVQNFEWEFSQYAKKITQNFNINFEKIIESNPQEAKKFMSVATLDDIQRFFSFVRHKDVGIEIHRFPFFDNFHTKFPGWQFWESAHRAKNDADILFTEPLIQADPDSIDEEVNSEKYAQQSLWNFFNDLEKALSSHKIKPEEITTLIQKRAEARLTPQYHEIDTELHMVLLPVYYILREQWYSHWDLD